MRRLFWGAICAFGLLGSGVFFHTAQNQGLAHNLVVSARVMGGFSLFATALVVLRELVPVKYRLSAVVNLRT